MAPIAVCPTSYTSAESLIGDGYTLLEMDARVPFYRNEAEKRAAEASQNSVPAQSAFTIGQNTVSKFSSFLCSRTANDGSVQYYIQKNQYDAFIKAVDQRYNPYLPKEENWIFSKHVLHDALQARYTLCKSAINANMVQLSDTQLKDDGWIPLSLDTRYLEKSSGSTSTADPNFFGLLLALGWDENQTDTKTCRSLLRIGTETGNMPNGLRQYYLHPQADLSGAQTQLERMMRASNTYSKDGKNILLADKQKAKLGLLDAGLSGVMADPRYRPFAAMPSDSADATSRNLSNISLLTSQGAASTTFLNGGVFHALGIPLHPDDIATVANKLAQAPADTNAASQCLRFIGKQPVDTDPPYTAYTLAVRDENHFASLRGTLSAMGLAEPAVACNWGAVSAHFSAVRATCSTQRATPNTACTERKDTIDTLATLADTLRAESTWRETATSLLVASAFTVVPLVFGAFAIFKLARPIVALGKRLLAYLSVERHQIQADQTSQSSNGKWLN